MSELLPFLPLLACPLGMVAMIGLPALVRRFKRRPETTAVGGG